MDKSKERKVGLSSAHGAPYIKQGHTTPAIYAARKLFDYFKTDIQNGKARSGQAISVAVIRLFEAAATWEIDEIHPDTKTEAIMQVVPFLGVNCNKLADNIAEFFLDVKHWNQTRDNNKTLPYFERLKEMYPDARMDRVKKDGMAGLISNVILAISHEPHFANRTAKIADIYPEINSVFTKAGFEGAPMFVLSFVNNIYKVIK